MAIISLLIELQKYPSLARQRWENRFAGRVREEGKSKLQGVRVGQLVIYELGVTTSLKKVSIPRGEYVVHFRVHL